MTVDPNLLPPPPPRVKPKPTQVTVICRLCGTRIYVPLEKIGQEIKCPDCHTRNEVPALKEAAPKKPAGPTLEGTEEYGMSEVVERPKYRPLVAARGEYDVLSAMDPASLEHRLTVPGERPRQHRAATEREVDAEDEEVVLSPPVERVEVQRVPVNYVEIEPEDPMYDGRYEDGLIGDMVDPRSPDAWKRAPLVYGIVEFVFYLSTLPRWIVSGIWLALVVSLGQATLTYAMADDQAQILGILLILIFVPMCAMWVVHFSATLLTIVQETANGNKEVTSWPEWNFIEWIPGAAYCVVAGIASALPGFLLSVALIVAGIDWKVAAFGVAAPPVLSGLVLFPLVLYSMLAEASVMAVFSTSTVRSLHTAAAAWVFFYMYAIVLCLLAVGAGSLFLLGNFVGSACGAAGLVAVAFIYARLVGRVMWYAAQKEAGLAPTVGHRPATSA